MSYGPGVVRSYACYQLWWAGVAKKLTRWGWNGLQQVLARPDVVWMTFSPYMVDLWVGSGSYTQPKLKKTNRRCGPHLGKIVFAIWVAPHMHKHMSTPNCKIQLPYKAVQVRQTRRWRRQETSDSLASNRERAEEARLRRRQIQKHLIKPNVKDYSWQFGVFFLLFFWTGRIY